MEKELSEEIRLQKYLANIGIASRRKCEEYILQGKIKVNEKIINKLGTKIIPLQDKIEFENKILKIKKEEKIYILLNKPIGCVTTVKEQFRQRYSFRFNKNK